MKHQSVGFHELGALICQIGVKFGEELLDDLRLSQGLEEHPNGFGIGNSLMQIEP